MPSIYDIDFGNVALFNLRRKKRKPKFLAAITAAIRPLVMLYQDFKQYRKNKLYELSITPQTCRMECLLNDRYDFTLRRIYIEDAKEFPPVYLYRDVESKPVYLYRDSEAQPVYLFTDSEGAIIGDDFIVYVPVSLVFDSNEMRSLVKKFKLPGMKFKIQTF
jgi:hypothetical protein